MERGKSTDFILKQFRKKSKRLVNKDLFTEFFYLNRERSVIEFLTNGGDLLVNQFFKEFLPSEFRSFASVKIHNDSEEEVKTWYYEEENLILIIDVNWGFKKQEISIEIDIEQFEISVIDEHGEMIKSIDYILLNDYLISFLTLQARNLSQTFEILQNRKKKN
jgi:hypothetical protein